MSKKNELLQLNDALLTMPAKMAFNGYDDQGNELAIEVYVLELLLTDGRLFIHPTTGERDKVSKLEQKIRARGIVNLAHWSLVRGKQNYN
ncbi:hypothetical protein ACPFUC_003664 [Vibrio cholerae]|jgi:hypothetical protein